MTQGIGTDDGQYYENRLEYLVNSSRGATDKKFSDAKEINTNSQAGDFESRFNAVETAPRMPLEATEKLTDAFKSRIQYETPLDPTGEENFTAWKQKYAPNDSGEDYDLRGAFKAGLTPARDGHWPDTYKKPNHPTFSDESIYAKDAPDKAGSWDGEFYVPPKYIPPKEESGIKTSSPLVTITNEDIDKGMGLAMSFSGGGLSTIRRGPQVRKGANDNAPVYNPREPNMIGSKEIDDSIDAGFRAFTEKSNKITELYSERAELHNIRKERDWSDIDLARYNKIGKEINKVTGDSQTVMPLDKPLKKYEYAKDLDALLKEFKEVFDKIEK